MTTEAFTGAPAYVIGTTGPYSIPHPYQSASDLIVTVKSGTSFTVLEPGDYSVSPTVALTGGGDLTLTPAARTAHAGGTLYITRQTAIEQGWEGVSGPRERGLERQLDRLAQALQDQRAGLGRALVLPPGSTASRVFPAPGAGQYIGWSPDGTHLEVKAPPTIRTEGGFSIVDFPGGAATLAQPPETADWTAVVAGALSTGERVLFPRWDYRFNSFTTSEGFDNCVNLDQDAPIDVACALGARFILGPEAVGRSGAMFRFKAAEFPKDYSAPLVPFRWIGGEFSAVDLTAAHGQGSGSGMQFLDLYWYHMPELRGIRFDGGYTTLTETNNGVGSGFMDCMITTHGLAGARFEDLSFIGAYDAAIYLSGVRDRLTLAANPFTMVNGSPIVTCAWPLNGLSAGMYVHFQGAAPAHGLTIYGQYLVETASTNSFTFSAGAAATSSGTGGGAAVMATSQLSDMLEWAQGGADTRISGMRAWRCGNGIVSKRNQRDTVVHDPRIFQCGGGIASAEIDEPNSYGKGWRITGGHLRQIRGIPITLVGGDGDVIDGVRIEQWGKTLASRGVDFTPIASGKRIGAINVRSCIAPKVVNCSLRQDGAWLTGTPDVGKEPVGISVRADNELAWAKGTQFGHFANNDIDGAYIAILEYPEQQTGGNNWHDNRVRNDVLPSVFASSSHVTLPRSAPFTPAIAVAGGAVTAEIAAGEWSLDHSVCQFYGYVDLLSLSSPSGQVRITGLPFPSAWDWPITVTLTPSLIALSAGYSEIVGQILGGESEISLYQKNASTGDLQTLQATALNPNSRIAFSGAYRRLVA